MIAEQRTVIKFYAKLGKSLQEVNSDLQTVYGDSVLTYACIRKWFRRFSEGRESVQDDERKGRPVSVKTETLVSSVENYVLEDRRVSVRNIAESFSISYGTAQEILTGNLGMRRVCARWVPRLLLPEQKRVRVNLCQEYIDRYSEEGDQFLNSIITCDETWVHFFEPESKQQSSVWKHPTSPSPVKARVSKSAGKVMMIIFCDSQGIVLQHTVPDKTTVNAEYYSCLLRTQLQRAVREKRPNLYRSGYILHQDNAPVHTSRQVKAVIQTLGCENLPHPPYSPDLAICDFWLFPTLKDMLRGKRHESREELGVAVTKALRVMSRDGLQHVFRTWTERWNKCVASGGSYFEKE